MSQAMAGRMTSKIGGLTLPNPVICGSGEPVMTEAGIRAALDAGGKDNGAPGLRPHYHANYYAAFVIGPDGHNIEVVCHVPEA